MSRLGHAGVGEDGVMSPVLHVHLNFRQSLQHNMHLLHLALPLDLN